MKRTFMAAAVALMLLSVCIMVPSADAASGSVSETKYCHSKYSGIVDFSPNMKLSSDYDIDLYTIDEYNKWMTDGSGTKERTVSDGEIVSDVLCTYGVVSDGSMFTCSSSTNYLLIKLTRADVFMYSFTGLLDQNVSAHIDFGAHTGSVSIIACSVSFSGTVSSNPISVIIDNPEYSKKLAFKQTYDEDVNSADISFGCDNTDVYSIYVGYSDEQVATCSMDVSGIADFTDSNALSIILIVAALAILAILLFISNRKLIE